jgi:hypothetical protein
MDIGGRNMYWDMQHVLVHSARTGTCSMFTGTDSMYWDMQHGHFSRVDSLKGQKSRATLH